MTRVTALALLALSSCEPAETPELLTYGAVNPLCVLVCVASTTSADATGDVQQSVTHGRGLNTQ